MRRPGSRIGVLDVESVPDADALANARRHSRGGHARPALHRIVSATVLTCRAGADGFADLDIRTFAHPEFDETAILGCVDLVLPDPTDPNATLVTWNGSHDLRLLRHRACANWMFGLRSVGGWWDDPAGRHDDAMAMTAGADPYGRWALADVCAGLGFPIRAGLSGRTVLSLHAQERHDGVAEHNRMDVVGTFLAWAYGLSFATGDERWTASAWVGGADLLAGVAHVDPDVQPLARHHIAAIARSRITAPAPDGRGARGARAR